MRVYMWACAHPHQGQLGAFDPLEPQLQLCAAQRGRWETNCLSDLAPPPVARRYQAHMWCTRIQKSKHAYIQKENKSLSLGLLRYLNG